MLSSERKIETDLAAIRRAREELLGDIRRDGGGEIDLWRGTSDGKWSIGEHLLHLYKMMQFFRLWIRAFGVVQRPVAKLLAQRPYAVGTPDLFARARAEGRPLKAPFVIAPTWPRGKPRPTLEELERMLESERSALERMASSTDDRILGHTYLWDPVMGMLNAIQVVELLAHHERHHHSFIRDRNLRKP
ncbi:MAG TPA: DinB family protein [Paenibacillus sp.]|nr:DinB family protein [Paenibacillus sp.]